MQKNNTRQITETVYLEINGSEVIAELSFNYTPFHPGVYSAAPENCYPCTPEEFDLLNLKTEDGDNCDWMIKIISGDLIEQLSHLNE